MHVTLCYNISNVNMLLILNRCKITTWLILCLDVSVVTGLPGNLLNANLIRFHVITKVKTIHIKIMLKIERYPILICPVRYECVTFYLLFMKFSLM